MDKIFIGFLLIFLDFNLFFGYSQIGLIPDFVGYIVMIKGLEEMARESTRFETVKPYAIIMAVYTGILYYMDFTGITFSMGGLSLLLGVLDSVISLSISYNIVMGVIDMEIKYNTLLNGYMLKATWTILAIFSILSYVVMFYTAIAMLCIIIGFIASICFLVAFSNAKNKYYYIVGN